MNDKKIWLTDAVRAIEESRSVLIVNFRDMMSDLSEIPEAVDWISVKDRLPEDGEQVLVVKQLKDGRKSIDFGYYWSQYLVYDAAAGANVEKPVWVMRGNNDVRYWMPIPTAPEVDG